ncbi:sec3/syntaxin-related [Holotrichia oblita]|uniref:Sec3/syntaxin-related n=2 Tax=Holotrichia oblita TaxID=644536 RepID=A0ACB9SSH2_HOLOL|nr:sec3/syntaxin-related [Holotrichia oblita]
MSVYTLQQEVFLPNKEKIHVLCNVSKFLKKKKCSYLCIVSSMNPPLQLSIVQVKQTDKTFKRKRIWQLGELRSVDGKNDEEHILEFDLQLDKVYRWVASTARERKLFIQHLWRQCNKYFTTEKPVFKNIPKSWTIEDIMTPESTYVSSPLMDLENNVMEDIQPITEKEQEDLNRLMSDCEFAISNAEAFMQVLSRDLSLLDGENVQCVLASEVETLMEQLEMAINEVTKIETRLDTYDEILCHVRNSMENMEKKNSMIAIANRNNTLLLKKLENIVSQLDLPKKHQTTLENPDFSTPENIRLAIEASKALKDALNADIEPALLDMAAVQEQKKYFLKYKDRFSYSLNRQLNNLFIHYGNHKGETLRNNDNFSLPQHNAIHKELQAYTELMHWTKAMERKAYEHLRSLYTESLGKLYEKDIRKLFDVAREAIGVTSGTVLPMKNQALLGLDSDQWTTEPNTVQRDNFESTLDNVLSQLEPVCLQEQQFCVSFFQLDVLSPSTKNTQTTLDGIENDSTPIDKKPEKKMDEDVRKVMSSLFLCLEEELLNFIGCIEKQDSL